MKKGLLLLSALFLFIGCSKKLMITNDVLIKEKPNAGQTLGTAREGEKYEILDVYSYYLKIQTVVKGKTIVGFVYEPLIDQKKLIVLEKGATVFARMENFRGVDIIGSLYPNTKIKIIGGTFDWYNIKKGKITGWIYSQYLKVK